MFVRICSRCGRHEPTSEIRCSDPNCREILPPKTIEVSEIPLTHTTLPLAAVSDVRIRSDSRACGCHDKKPEHRNGVLICKGCGRRIAEAFSGTSSSSASPEQARRDKSARLSREEQGGNAVAEMSVALPWGETVPFTERLMLGRAAHPNPLIPSLPGSARARLQREYQTVSRFHVLLTEHEGGVRIEDLGAMNGSFIGDMAIQAGSSVHVELPCELKLGRSFAVTIRRSNA